MAGGTYSALSGLRTRLAQLDRIASDIANAGTAGYKTERVPTVEVARGPTSARCCRRRSTSPPRPGLDRFPRRIDRRPPNRDLDVALEGRGFFEIETAEGVRYTRNGQFSRRPDGTLVTADGAVVQRRRRRGRSWSARAPSPSSRTARCAPAACWPAS